MIFWALGRQVRDRLQTWSEPCSLQGELLSYTNGRLMNVSKERLCDFHVD